ncbi:MAG: substrate-binding domain-containing protein [Holophagales bacterium]|nr:substrate-binding domain-containing protein [Holophagales bacterium]
MTLSPVGARTRLAALVSLSLLLVPACARRESPSGDAAPPVPKDAVVVKVSYGSEKKGFLTDSIEAFHASNPKSAGGKPIRIEAVAEGSAESMEAILAGESDVHVWSPASSLLVDVLNARWAEKQGLGGGKPLAPEIAELETLETALKILAQESAALLAPGEVAARLDELVAGAEAAGETVREIEELSRQGEAAQRQRVTLLQ